MLGSYIENIQCIGAYAGDLGAVADDVGIAGQFLDFFIGQHRAAGHVEVVKGLFKARPLCRDHAPDKSCTENAGGHFSEHLRIVQCG